MRATLLALAWLSLTSPSSPPQGGITYTPVLDNETGITRTTLLEKSEVRVVRVQFAPGSREPVHTHPNDL
jgi:quercetin dioxygenase-like cupin family protein